MPLLSKLWLAVPVLTACVFPSLSCCEAVPIQLHGLNYNTRKGPDWDWDKCKARHEVLRDLTMLSRVTSRIRLLSITDCGQADLVLDVAHELGLQMWLGMWVGPETSVFEDEKAALLELLEGGMIDEATVLGISVGSEAIYRDDATIDEMIGYMNEVYQILQDAGLNIPVTICDVAPEFAASSKLRAAVNVTMTNTFPFWEGIDIDLAVADLQEDLGWLLQQQESKNKPFVLGETGWPSDGYIEGVGIAGPDEQVQYFKEAFCRIDVVNRWSYYWFTFIDNAWRREQDPDNTIEGNWGFLYANLTLKHHFEGFEFSCSNGVTYSFAEVDWSIPDFTAAPAVMDPASCSAHSNCEGLFGNCCPGDNGMFLNCCDATVSSTRAPSIAPVIAPSSAPIPTARPQAPTQLPTTTRPQATESPTITPGVSKSQTPPPSVAATADPIGPPTATPVTPLPTSTPTTPKPSVPSTTSLPTQKSSTTTTSLTAGPSETATYGNETSAAPTSGSTMTVTGPTAGPTPKPSVEVVYRPTAPSGDEDTSSSSSNNANSGTSCMGPCNNFVLVMGAAILSGLLLQ